MHYIISQEMLFCLLHCHHPAHTQQKAIKPAAIKFTATKPCHTPPLKANFIRCSSSRLRLWCHSYFEQRGLCSKIPSHYLRKLAVMLSPLVWRSSRDDKRKSPKRFCLLTFVLIGGAYRFLAACHMILSDALHPTICRRPPRPDGRIPCVRFTAQNENLLRNNSLASDQKENE